MICSVQFRQFPYFAVHHCLNMYILIADSGSTKTQWSLVRSADDINAIHTQGINPYFTDTHTIVEMLESELLPELNGEMPDHVFYYGTGCSVPEKEK